MFWKILPSLGNTINLTCHLKHCHVEYALLCKTQTPSSTPKPRKELIQIKYFKKGLYTRGTDYGRILCCDGVTVFAKTCMHAAVKHNCHSPAANRLWIQGTSFSLAPTLLKLCSLKFCYHSYKGCRINHTESICPYHTTLYH